MNKFGLIASMAEKANITKVDSEKVLNAFLDTIVETVASGDKVALSGFGTFNIKECAARVARNPKTGESVDVFPKRVPVFKVSKKFKETINQ